MVICKRQLKHSICLEFQVPRFLITSLLQQRYYTQFRDGEEKRAEMRDKAVQRGQVKRKMFAV
jgi:hypothetical protein